MDKMFTQAKVEKGSFNDEERSFVAWASKPVLDRDGEIIASNAWDIENYEKNKVILWAHNYSMPPVGKALWVKLQNNGVKFKPQFAPTDMGKELYMLYKEGFLNSFSVGFDPKDFEEDGRTVRVLDFWTGEKYDKPVKTFTEAELLEISCVPVPACPDALVERAKEGKIKTKGLVKAILEMAHEKPETTEGYHRIPVRECEITATIDIDSDKGIKGLYCGDIKKVGTYLFDVDQWTMDEAKEWVKEHDDGKDTDADMEKIHTSAGEVSGAWQPIETEEPDPYERMREDGLARTIEIDGVKVVPVTPELWNNIIDNTKLLTAQLPQPDMDKIEETEQKDAELQIELSDEEFNLLVQKEIENRELRETVKQLSHKIAEVNGKLRVLQGGIG